MESVSFNSCFFVKVNVCSESLETVKVFCFSFLQIYRCKNTWKLCLIRHQTIIYFTIITPRRGSLTLTTTTLTTRNSAHMLIFPKGGKTVNSEPHLRGFGEHKANHEIINLCNWKEQYESTRLALGFEFQYLIETWL